MLVNKLPLNLQFFAEEGIDGDQTPNEQSGGQEQTDQKGTDSQQQSEDKTFTQEDVNNLISRETKKQQEKLLKQLGVEDFENAKEGMRKFKEWQESQKTEAEKQAERLQELEESYSNASKENETLKAQISAMKQGVKGESVEDVVILAKNMLSDDVDMETAIKEVIEKYPHFAQEEQKEEPKPKFTTGKHTSDGLGESDPFKAKLAKYK